MAACLQIAIVHHNVDSEHGMRPRTFRVTLCFCDYADLLPKLEQLLDVLRGSYSFARKILDCDLTSVVPDIEIALVCI